MLKSMNEISRSNDTSARHVWYVDVISDLSTDLFCTLLV